MTQSTFQRTVERCARICERRHEKRFEDFGIREPDTNATYYSGSDADENDIRDDEDDSCAAAIRALQPDEETGWRPIESAPRDGTEVLIWRADCGAMIGRYAALQDFLSDRECEEMGPEAAEKEDWFGGDSINNWRLDGSETPTHWQPLPPPPDSQDLRESG